MLFTLPDECVRVSVRERRVFAELIVEDKDAPRSGTRSSSLSVLRKLEVRLMASERSDGTLAI
jgi:hypothetical protein